MTLSTIHIKENAQDCHLAPFLRFEVKNFLRLSHLTQVSVRLLSFYYGGQNNIYHTYKKAWVHLITVHAPACSKSRSEQSWLAVACFGLFIFRAVQKADRADVAHNMNSNCSDLLDMTDLQ